MTRNRRRAARWLLMGVSIGVLAFWAAVIHAGLAWERIAEGPRRKIHPGELRVYIHSGFGVPERNGQ